MSDKLKVVLQVSVPRVGPIWTGAAASDLLNFTGETELSLPDLRKILAAIVTGASVSLGEYPVVTVAPVESAVELSEWDKALSSWEPVVVKPRKSPRRKTSLVCVRCARPFKGMSITQKYCHKKDCETVAAALVKVAPARKSQKGIAKNYPSKRISPTPLTPAVCERCGRSYMAYTSRQKRCGLADCRTYAMARKTVMRQWRPQATIVAGEGVTAGAV